MSTTTVEGDAAAKLVPLALLRERPGSLRGVDKTTQEYADLVESVRGKGVLQSILVRPAPGEPEAYEIINGLRRYSAACDAGCGSIPCRVDDIADDKVLEYQLVTNVHTIETKPVDCARAMQAIFDKNPTMTIADMAAKLHKSVSWVNGMLNMLRLEKGVADLVNRGKIKLANGHALAKLPVEEQLKLVDSAMILPADEFTGIVNNRLRELRQAAKEGKLVGEPEFAPVLRPRKPAEIKAELDEPKALKTLVQKARSREDAIRETLAWTLGLDKESLVNQRAEFDSRRKLEEVKREARAARQQKAQIAAGEADVAAGRLVDHETVAAEFNEEALV